MASNSRSRVVVKSDRKRGRFVPRLLFSLTTLLLSLGAVEIALRYTMGKPWYERVAEEQAATMGKVWRVGESWFTLRSAANFAPKQSDAYRILFLGDSFTYGQGLASESDTFVKRIVARLNERQTGPTRTRYEAFNGGIPGSLTPHWVRLCDEILDSYDPDLVVAVFFLRDGLAGITSIGQIDQIRDGMRQFAKDSFLFRHSSTYRFFRERRAQTELAGRYLSQMRHGYLGDAEQTRQWRQAQADLLAIKRLALEVNARFSMVVFPVLFDLTAKYPLKDVCNEIVRFAEADEIPALSLLPAFMGRDAEPLWISPFDQHPNATGHAIAADGIIPFVERLVRDGVNEG
ncbi:MAG: hypothetical protein IIC02_04165 [Planctomycetes bacterium]|nr:hypothetical protein [Planctomycetota bacterium]